MQEHIEVWIDVLPAKGTVNLIRQQGTAVLVVAELGGQIYEPVWVEMAEPGKLVIQWAEVARVRVGR